MRAAIAAILCGIAIFGVIAPSLRPLFPSAAIARAIRAADCPSPAVASAGFHEPSLVFLTGTATRLTDGGGAAEFLRFGPCRYAVVEGRQERAFVQRAEAAGLRYRPVAKIDGININGGRSLSIAVYRSEKS
jgi:hypothetical protein